MTRKAKVHDPEDKHQVTMHSFVILCDAHISITYRDSFLLLKKKQTSTLGQKGLFFYKLMYSLKQLSFTGYLLSTKHCRRGIHTLKEKKKKKAKKYKRLKQPGKQRVIKR